MNALVASKAKANFARIANAGFMPDGARPQHGGGKQFSDFSVRMTGQDFRR